MNIKCLFGHQWNGCKCERCGALRSTGHAFEWAKDRRREVCSVCGKEREKPKLRSFGKEVKGNYTYEYYAASSAEEARLFLSFCEVTQPLYYIQIETPEGVWGMDKDGLFLGELLPFQKNLSLAQCKASKHTMPGIYEMALVSKGVADNAVVTVGCGSCGKEWKDGIRVNDNTVVKCPACKKYNLVEFNVKINFVNT
jgi:hypothetical protein